jgi:hypothetical protein
MERFLFDLPNDAIVIDRCGNHRFKDLYFVQGYFWYTGYWDGDARGYARIPWKIGENGQEEIEFLNLYGKKVTLTLRGIKRKYFYAKYNK